MGRVYEVVYQGERVLCVDYSGLREAEMVKLMEESRDLVVTANEPTLVLIQFDSKSYVTPVFMRRAEQINKELGGLIKDQAFVGLTEVKKFILKGFNLFLGKNYKAFDTKEEALQHLVSNNKDK